MAENGVKYPHFENTPFNFEFRGVKVECNDKGIIKLTKENEKEDSYDEIDFPASLINRIHNMLLTTRRKVWKDYPYKEEE
jgi:hypothetical protein